MIKKTLVIILAIISSIWNATVKVAWGIVIFLALIGIVYSAQISSTNIVTLINLAKILMKYLWVFWIVFFTESIYSKVRWEFED